MSLGKPSRGDGRVLWGASPDHRTIGELLTASDVCHLPERCGVLLGGEPDRPEETLMALTRAWLYSTVVSVRIALAVLTHYAPVEAQPQS